MINDVMEQNVHAGKAAECMCGLWRNEEHYVCYRPLVHNQLPCRLVFGDDNDNMVFLNLVDEKYDDVFKSRVSGKM